MGLPAPLTNGVHVQRLPHDRNTTQNNLAEHHERGVIIPTRIRRFCREAMVDFVDGLLQLAITAVNLFIQFPETLVSLFIVIWDRR